MFLDEGQFDILSDTIRCAEENAEQYEDDFAAIDELHKQERARRLRKERLSNCGNWSYWFDPHTGQRQSYRFYCDLFRECPVCLERRARQERENLTDRMFYGDKFNWFIAETDDVVRTLRNVGAKKSDYVRYPLDDDMELVLLSASFGIGEPVTHEWISESNWEALVNTPEGRNKSGTALYPRTEKDDEEFTIIEFEEVVTDAPGGDVVDIMEAIIARTYAMSPSTPEEVLQCMSTRISMLSKHLNALEHKVTIYYRTCKLIHSQIAWKSKPPP